MSGRIKVANQLTLTSEEDPGLSAWPKDSQGSLEVEEGGEEECCEKDSTGHGVAGFEDGGGTRARKYWKAASKEIPC